ncbi:glycosyltransferase family 39 protein [Pelagibacterales bacterium SAG-MED41]|nr:glycosyltransferase family 39 protein [Pelagibacterales bacterium SAG-MED41]
MKKINPLYLIIISSFLVKIFAVSIVGDQKIMNEWSFLIHNFNASGVFGYNVVVNDFFATPLFADSDDIVLPTVYMPPLYFFLIYFLQVASAEFFNLTKLVIFVQIILSTVSVFFLYKILQKIDNSKLTIIFTALFAFFPISIYASTQISSITLQIFLLILYLYFLSKFFDKHETKDVIVFSFISALLILTRGEFFIFFIFTIFYTFIYFKVNLKLLLVTLLITTFLVSPYLIRNYKVFNELVLTKSFGYNLLKGNYKEFKVEGNPKIIEKDFKIENLGIKTDKYFEINLDNFYKDEAIKYIKNDPFRFLINYPKKALTFLFINLNSSYPGYYNLIHLLPKILISFFSFIGLILLIKKKRGFFQFLAVYYILNILFFSIFFILPRYSLIILPIQILLSISCIKFFLRKIFN